MDYIKTWNSGSDFSDIASSFLKKGQKRMKEILVVLYCLIIAVIAGTGVILLFPEYIEASGVIIPEEYRAVFSNSSGRIENIAVSDGGMVKNNATIATLDLSDEKNKFTHVSEEIRLNEQLINGLHTDINILKKQYENGYDYHTNRFEATELAKNRGTVSGSKLEDERFYRNEFISNYQINNNRLEKNIIEIQLKNNSLQYEKNHLMTLIKEADVKSPVAGIFTINSLLNENERFKFQLIPDYQPGRFISKGECIGFVYSPGNYVARVEVGENKINKLKTGSLCTIKLNSSASFEAGIIKGIIVNIAPVAINRSFITTIKIKEIDSAQLETIVGIGVRVTIKSARSTLLKRITGGE